MKTFLARPIQLRGALSEPLRPLSELALVPKTDHWSATTAIRASEAQTEARTKGWTEKSRSGRR